FLAYAYNGGPGESVKKGAATIDMEAGSLFTTGGWVSMGPGTTIFVGHTGALRIGEGTYFNRDVQVNCRVGIDIGEACAIAWDVTIMDCDHHAVAIDGELKDAAAPITIGDHVW